MCAFLLTTQHNPHLHLCDLYRNGSQCIASSWWILQRVGFTPCITKMSDQSEDLV